MSATRAKGKARDDDETLPLLSSDNSRASLTGRPGYTENLDPEFQYFLKGKYPTSVSVVADSEVQPPILPREPNKQSSLVTIFVLWNTMVGTSLLTMPWGIERAGLGMGIVLVIVMGALCCYTAHCVVATQAAYGPAGGEISELTRHLLGRRAQLLSKLFSYIVLIGALIVYWILMSNFLYFTVDYVYRPAGGEISELTRHLLGRRAELLSKLFSYIVLIGALIVYWILMSNFLYFTVDYVYTAVTGGFDGVSMSSIGGSERCLAEEIKSNVTLYADTSLFRQFWNLDTSVPIYLVLLIGPILSFKSVTFFTKFNSLGTLSLIYLMLFVLVKAYNWGFHLNTTDPHSVDYSSWIQPSFFATSGILAMSYFMQNIVISIMRSNRDQKNNTRDLAVAYSLGMGTYLVIGTVFYISFPLKKSCIEDNMLNNFASWDVGTLVARVFLFFQLVTVFPLISFMLRYQVMTAFFTSSYPSRLHIVTFNAIVVTTCVLFAVFLPRIGTIIRFTGALSGFFHVFTLPCVLRLAAQRQSGGLSVASVLLNLAIPLAGGINLVAQFFVSDS